MTFRSLLLFTLMIYSSKSISILSISNEEWIILVTYKILTDGKSPLQRLLC